MVTVVVALVASVLIQWRGAECWQGSISAYYYSPVRPIFVTTMVVIGVSLIVIKGSTVVEDTLLNLAGMLAPIVAFVPTSFEASCRRDEALDTAPLALPADIVRDVHNNIGALLAAGFTALAIAVLIFAIEQVRGSEVATRYWKSQAFLLASTGALLGIGWWLWTSEKILELHGWSAVFMFVALGLASIGNGAWLFWKNRGGSPPTSPRWMVHAVSYILVGVVMGVAGVVIMFVVPDPWVHRVLVLEMTEVGLFVAMWVIQSVERWGKILQAGP